MQNIKFKVWDKKNNCWLKNTEEPKDDNLFIEETGVNNSGIYEVTNWGNIIYCLATGLKDKNGKEIYEKDIITADGIENVEVNYSMLSWYGGSVPLIDFTRFSNVEVIGNIFQNKNLLEK